MARHNREGEGVDQLGFRYRVGFQPDWLRVVKVTRELASGRQSTKTLFRNPARTRVADPPERIRSQVASPPQGLRFQVAVTDPGQVVRRVVVECVLPGPGREGSRVAFTFLGGLPPPEAP